MGWGLRSQFQRAGGWGSKTSALMRDLMRVAKTSASLNSYHLALSVRLAADGASVQSPLQLTAVRLTIDQAIVDQGIKLTRNRGGHRLSRCLSC